MTGLDGYLDRLRALPPVRAVRMTRRGPREREAEVSIKTATHTHQLVVAQLTGRISALAAAGLSAAGQKTTAPGARLVVAPVIAGEAARLLAHDGTNYVDLAGNCHLVLGREVYVHVEGNRAPRAAPADRGIRAAGYQVLFTYLVDHDLERTMRSVGALAGVSRQTVLEMRQRLLDEGYLLDSGSGVRWNPRRRDDALLRWLEGYRSTVRPRLLAGVYRTKARDPGEVAAMIASVAGAPGERWRWGGSAAAYRLRRHYRGERTVIHVRDPVDALTHKLSALPDPGGNLVVLRAFGDIHWGPSLDTVHPLLVYSELLVGDDDRAREAAADLFDALIRPTWAS